MNLHHLLNWPDTVPDRSPVEYVWPPFATPGYEISDAELQQLKQSRIDFLRVTADPSIFIASSGPRREQLFSLVRQRLDRLIGAGFAVIFDLHPVEVNPSFGPLKLVERTDCPAFKRYADVVEAAARHFDSLPHDRFAFELMNEPWLDGAEERRRWQPMLETLHRRARAGSPTLPFIISGAAWGSIGALLELDLAPFAGSNLLYTFHYYDPHTFTHQGVEGDEAAPLSRLDWPAETTNLQRARADAFSTIDATAKSSGEKATARQVTEKLLQDYELTAHNAARMEADFDLVAKWADSHRIDRSRLLLGEFGCVAAGADKNPLGSARAAWFHAVRQAAEARSIAWALWAYKGYGGMGLFDDAGHRDETIAKALDL